MGTPAPDFTLPSTSGADVTLSSLRGKNDLLASFTEDYGRFRDANTELLSDFKREVRRRYGTLIEDKFFSRRAYVLLAQVMETHQRAA